MIQKKIMIGTPAYRRPSLLSINTRYNNNILKKFLEDRGFDVQHIIVGTSKVEQDAMIGCDLEYHEMKNVLSHKKNYILKLAKERNVDYLLWIDSDDFIPINLALETIQVSNENGWWASVENMFIYDLFQKRMVHFNGYDNRHCLKGHGLGTCCIYTKKMLEHLPFDAFGIDKQKAMEFHIFPHLKKIGIPLEKRLIKTKPNNTLVGIKTSQNIWHLRDFKTNVLSEISFDLKNDVFDWLDKEYVDSILNVDPKNP